MKEVYFAQAANGLTKIGYSNDIEKRKYHLGWKEHGKIEILHSIPCGNQFPHFIESAFHYCFRHRHIEGEWFDLNLEDIEWCKTIKHADQTEAISLVKRWHKEGQSAGIKRTKYLMQKGTIS